MADKTSVRPSLEERLLFSLLMGDSGLVERVFCARAAAVMLASDELRGRGLASDELLVLVSPVSGMLPDARVLTLLDGMRLLERSDGVYRLRPTVAATDFDVAGEQRPSRSLASLQWSLDDLVATVLPPPEDASWTIRNVRDAIHGGFRWLLGTLACDADGRPQHTVLPAFWRCDGDVDTPVGTLPAVTSVGDSLAALADGVHGDVALGHVAGDHAPALRNAVEQLLTYPVERVQPPHWDARMIAWNAGGFLPHDDQPESAYPTVDATWDALIALAGVVDAPSSSYPAFRMLADLGPTLEAQTVASLRFLLRMQLPDGGWGIYRYLDDSAPVPPYEFTTSQTILALGLALGTDLLSDPAHAQLRTDVERALRRAWTFLHTRAGRVDGLMAWAPYFRADIEVASTLEVVCSSCWVATGLLVLLDAFDDLADEIAPALVDVTRLVDRDWAPDYRRIADASFRAPLAERLNDTFGKWSNRYDVAIVVTLLGMFKANVANPALSMHFGDSLWERIERTVGSVLEEQHSTHGHWNEPVEGMPLAAATAAALLLLQSYLSASIAVASGRDVVPPEA